MSLFSSRRRTRPATTTTTRRTRFRNPLRRRDPDRVAGGFKAALSNPNTTRDGRKQAKRQLRRMVSSYFTARRISDSWTRALIHRYAARSFRDFVGSGK